MHIWTTIGLELTVEEDLDTVSPLLISLEESGFSGCFINSINEL